MSKETALLIVDMLNPMEFPEAEQLLPMAEKAGRCIQALKIKLKAEKVPVVYVNDNFGHWRSDWKKVYKRCIRPGSLGRGIARLLMPDPNDYFVLKPRHSGFYLTPLELLLAGLGVKRLILTGIAGNLCVFFTAHDAHMRGYEVTVPRDCVASNTKSLNEGALRQLRAGLGLSTPYSRKIMN
jgi:nicotinamidase-related amidase